MNIFIFFLAVFWLSFCFAKVEIAIEGPYGFGEKLPTWKLSEKSFLSRFFYGGRPVTGYHIWAAIFIISILHLVYLFQVFSLKTELQVISFLLFFSIFEDFFWFVFNPAYGLKKFKKENIWWHEKAWWLFAPREYFIFIPLGLILYFFS